MNEVLERIGKEKIVAIFREDTKQKAFDAARACIDGGLGIVEITMNTAKAEELISDLSRQFPEVLVGAGTVLDVDQANKAINAGAKFVVSPHTDADIINACKSRNILVSAGTTTPTEMLKAHNLGVELIKVFPVESLGGAKYITALRGPLPHFKFMPTGGVDLINLHEYFIAGAFAVGVSRSLVHKDAIELGLYTMLTKRAKEFKAKMELIKQHLCAK